MLLRRSAAALALPTACATAALLLASCSSSGDGSVTTPSPSPSPAPSPSPSPSPTPTPTAFDPPADQTVTVGQQALFAVDAPGASSWQWLRNGQPISGATSATYLTAPATAGDDGAKYAVQVGINGSASQSAPATLHIHADTSGAPPASFWGDLSSIPSATRVMTVKFVNRTNGHASDAQLFWKLGGKAPDGSEISEMHSFAEKPVFDMPSIGSARMYFFIAPDASQATTEPDHYYDFIELNIGRSSASQPYRFNGNTTRVDAFGLKTAIRLRCDDGTDVSRGEDYGTFLEDRAITFAKYRAEVPAAFQDTADKQGPYRILEPGAAGFSPNGTHANYYRDYIDQVWAANGIDESIVPKPKPPLIFANNQYPDLEAAVARHVAEIPGTFGANGKLKDPDFWRKIPASRFYQAEPANFYAAYWHKHAISGLAYGFPYDDVGNYSSFVACDRPSQLIVAIGW